MALSDQIRQVEERVQDALSNMTSRDRNLLYGLVVFGVLVVLGGLGWWASSSIGELNKRLSDREETLQRLKVLAAEHASSEDDARAIQARIQEHAGTDLAAYVEQVAERSRVKDRLDSVREKSSAVEGDIEDHLYTITLSKLQVQEMVDFIYELEATGYPLKIRTYKAKTRKSGDAKLVDLTLDVSAFRMAAGAAGTEG
jgi:type II secretory pathway component PulM